jgi:serine/threonine-protein kinase HipA
MRKAEVWINTTLAGILSKTEEGYFFEYDTLYLSQDNLQPVSLTLPIQSEVFHSKNLFAFFDGLIPEGWLLNIAQKNWKLNSQDRMGLLLAMCKDCIGNVSIIEKL